MIASSQYLLKYVYDVKTVATCMLGSTTGMNTYISIGNWKSKL